MSDREDTSIAAQAQPPEESVAIQIKPISKVAGGVPAVVEALKSAWSEMGVVRGTRTLLQLNQTGGFDCPGCAWPEPDRERSHAEFCENGAKHVADEATTKRLTPEFFSAMERRRSFSAIGLLAGTAGTSDATNGPASERHSLRAD